MRTVALISCVSMKLDRPAKARDLYLSPLFKYALKYAESLHPDGICILSAKYGLLGLETIVEPYELTLNAMPVAEVRAWARRVLGQLEAAEDVDGTDFVFLAGEKYRRYLLPDLPNYRLPLEGLGIGRQLQKLKMLTS
jgi:hypothetical protein